MLLSSAPCLQVASLAAAGLAAAVAISTVTAAAAAAAQAESSSSAVSAVGSWLAAVPSWQTGVAAAVAVLLLAVHYALGQVKRRFMFMDYVHAAIP
jgi:hypothetical protein